MNKLMLFNLLVFLNVHSYAQQDHKDQLEYNFQGNIHKVIKRSYNAAIVNGEIILENNQPPLTVYTYYFNLNGNMDSSFTDKMMDPEKYERYKTVYFFSGIKKSGWEITGEEGQLVLSGKIKWLSDTSYVEEVNDASGRRSNYAKTVLNNLFRIVETHVISYDHSGKVMHNNIKKFKMDNMQNTEFAINTNQLNGVVDRTEYEYRKTDILGNPLEVILRKEGKQVATVLKFEFIYGD